MACIFYDKPCVFYDFGKLHFFSLIQNSEIAPLIRRLYHYFFPKREMSKKITKHFLMASHNYLRTIRVNNK